MSKNRSTTRRRGLRVALVGGVVALVSALGVGNVFAVGPWPGAWTGPFLPEGFNGPVPEHFNGPFPDNSSESAAPEDDWAPANTAASEDDDAWSVDLPASADDGGGNGGDAVGGSGGLSLGGGTNASGGNSGSAAGGSGGI